MPFGNKLITLQVNVTFWWFLEFFVRITADVCGLLIVLYEIFSDSVVQAILSNVKLV